MSKEREMFYNIVKDRSAKAAGKDSRIRSITTAQRKNEDSNVRDILRGNISWGTPIVIGGES